MTHQELAKILAEIVENNYLEIDKYTVYNEKDNDNTIAVIVHAIYGYVAMQNPAKLSLATIKSNFTDFDLSKYENRERLESKIIGLIEAMLNN